VKEIDSRPSDAIALAVRTNAPIFVTGRAMEALDMLPLVEEEPSDEDVEKFKKLVQDVQIEDED
jgi:hypothetical protein